MLLRNIAADYLVNKGLPLALYVKRHLLIEEVLYLATKSLFRFFAIRSQSVLAAKV